MPLKAEPKPKPRPPLTVEELQVKVLERLREVSTPRPRRKPGLVSYLINFSGKKFTANEIETLIANLGRANHLAIDDAGRVTYQLNGDVAP